MMTQVDTTLAALAISALRALALAGVAGLGLRLSGAKSTSVRLFVWRAVLFAALAMPFLGQVVPPLVIRAPGFAQSADLRSTSQPLADSSPLRFSANGAEQNGSRLSASLPTTVVATKPEARSTSASYFGRLENGIPWGTLPAAIYLIVTSIFLIRLAVGLALSRRLIHASHKIADPRLRRVLARSVGLSNSRQICESAQISVPVTVGAFRTAILLPLDWREWDGAQLNAVVAHELSHVSRRDALVQFVSLLHRAIFWFSPLSWWLDRHLATLAEEASDEAALSCGADRQHYAKTLLRFLETLQTAPGRVWWHGVSMAQPGRAEQRLERILSWRGPITMNLRKSLLVAIILFAIPAVYLVASVRPASPAQTGASAEEAKPAGVSLQSTAPPAAVPPMPGAPADGGVSISGPAPVGTVAPKMAVAPAAPPSLATPAESDSYAVSGQSHGRGYSYAYGYDDEERFVIVSGKSDSYTMSGSTQDIHHVERLKKQIPGDFIWFQRDEKSYIIRDQATIDRAKTFWAPQKELGKKQEALGKQQEALGKQQEELGKKMEEVRVNVPSGMTAKLDALKAKLQKLGPSATMEEMGDLQSEIGELQSQIGDIQGRAGEQQGKLGEEQGKLGEQQGKLGEEQGKLGEEQGRLAEEAVKKTKALFDECIKNGKAQPEPDGSHGASL